MEILKEGRLPLIDIESNYPVEYFEPIAFAKIMDQEQVALIAASPAFGDPPRDKDAWRAAWSRSLHHLVDSAPLATYR